MIFSALLGKMEFLFTENIGFFAWKQEMIYPKKYIEIWHFICEINDNKSFSY